jgi:hypothetical protein
MLSIHIFYSSARYWNGLLLVFSRPFVTGSSFWKQDDNYYHNDGAFAGLLQGLIPLSKSEPLFQPRQHHHSLLLPWRLDLLAHGLDILLGRDKATQFWEEGMKRGGHNPNVKNM